jgi:Golgi SNAP receptor complex protein 2
MKSASSSTHTDSTVTKLEQEYKACQKLIFEIRHDLEQLEREHLSSSAIDNNDHNNNNSIHSDTNDSNIIAYGVTKTMDEMESGVLHHRTFSNWDKSDMEREQERQKQHAKVTSAINNLSRSERTLRSLMLQLPFNRRESWKRQVEQISDELTFLRSSINKLLRHLDDSERDRQLLLGLSSSADKKWSTSAMTAEEDRMKRLSSQSSSLQRSITLVEQMKTTGASVLDMLSSQRETIHAAQRKVLDIGLMLGVSQSTIRMIERRNLMDKIIVYGGMILVSLLLFYIFWFRFWRR